MPAVQVRAISMGTFMWSVDVNDPVTAGQRIGSVTSYKIIMPLWAPIAGTITFRQPATVVRAGDVLFEIGASTSTTPVPPPPPPPPPSPAIIV